MAVPAGFYSASFGGVSFAAGKARRHDVEWDFSDSLMPSVPPAAATVYRDWMGRKPDTLSLPILIEDEQLRQDLADVSGYPGATLVTPQGSWEATLDKLSSAGYRENNPQVCTGEFTLGVEVAVVEATPPPIAGFVWSNTGLLVELDANQGTWSPDGVIDQVNIEWGSGGSTSTLTGPFGVGGIPSAFFTYPIAGTYIVNVSVEAGGQTSSDESQSVTVS